MLRRENTFRIDFTDIVKKPTYDEVHHFILSNLGLKREQIERIHCSRYFGCAFITVSDLETALKAVKEHDSMHELEADGKRHIIRITMVDGTVEVKLYDLSIDVTNEAITDFLSEYGEVYSVHEKLWESKYIFGGIPSGVRAVKMLVKQNIPSVVTIDGETTYLSYFGQKQTCRHCSEFVHNGVTCIMNKKLLVQKLAADQKNISYANATKSVPKPKQTKLLGPKAPEPKPGTSKPPAPKHPEERQTIAKPQEQQQPTTSKPPALKLPEDKQSATTAHEQKQLLLPSTTDTTQKARQHESTNITRAARSGVENIGLKVQLSQKTTRAEDPERVESSETDESTASNNNKRLRPRKPPPEKTKHDGGDDTQEDNNP